MHALALYAHVSLAVDTRAWPSVNQALSLLAARAALLSLDRAPRDAKYWRSALLLLVPHARAHHHGGMGDFHLDGQGRVTRRMERKVAPYIFTGIQLMAKRLIEGEDSEAFSTNRFWNRAIDAGRLYGVMFDGEWFDIGTPAAIKPTEQWFAHG